MAPKFYDAIIHTEEDGTYWAEVPSLPGCFTQGKTLDEVKLMLDDAVSLYLEAIEKDGLLVTPATSVNDNTHIFRIAA
jgi:predicted RNase H-like HicB family nuclease